MKEPTLLILDTSTRSTVLGLSLAGEITDHTTPAKNSHSREILPSVTALLEEAGVSLHDLDALVFGQGPGSFTGLRIAAGVVQGLAYGLDRPVVQVSTMAALAQSRFTGEADARNVCVALSARLQEVYFGAYAFENGLAVPVTAEFVADVTELPRLPGQHWELLGDAGEALGDRIEAATGTSFSVQTGLTIPRVEDLALLGTAGLAAGRTVDALHVAPVYLREEVADKPGSSP